MNQEKKYDVFISYSRKDSKVAHQVYDYLTMHGVSCWIDKFSIEPGEAYAAAIERGVMSASSLVVIYSKNVLDTNNVLSELELAHNHHKRIISFRLDDAPMREGYAFYLSLPQWINAIPRVSDALPLLLAAIKSQTCSVQQYARNAMEKRRKRRMAAKAGAVVLVGLLLVAGWYLHKPSDAAPAVAAPTINQDSLNRAQQAEIMRLRQDSIARALQAEADRLARERARLEEQARAAEQSRHAEAATTPTTKATTTTTPTPAEPTMAATPALKVAATPKTHPFAEAKAKADAGDAASCYKVAMAYKEGNGVEKNLPAAFSYMKSAAERGYTAAYIEVAKMYHGGRGVSKNRDIAEQWYQKAADAGNAEARRILLNM